MLYDLQARYNYPAGKTSITSTSYMPQDSTALRVFILYMLLSEFRFWFCLIFLK